MADLKNSKKLKNLLKNLEKSEQPELIKPMLAVLTDNYFSSKDFLYEHKWDGVRIVAYKNNGKVTLMTRNDNIANKSYPGIVQALKELDLDNFILDGEVVAMKNGLSSFGELQTIMHTTQSIENLTGEIYYCIFDLLYFDQYDLTNLELIKRKDILETAFNFKYQLILSEYILEYGLELYKKACEAGWEGIIAKNIHSKYVQKRSSNWLKFKCVNEQEFVIGGYTNPSGSRQDFGALLIGYYNNNDLIYAGKVGTGFNDQLLEDLGKKLNALKQKDSPFKSVDINIKDVHWVKPELVAEIRFLEWTSGGKLRHASFIGLRHDKSPKEVVKEMPKHNHKL